jgi:hypothetical protein
MTSPEKFKNEIITCSTDIIWDQWQKIGVWLNPLKEFEIYTDPEAILLFSNYLKKFEPRLEKISKDWFNANRKYVNLSRLKKMERELIKILKNPEINFKGTDLSREKSKYILDVDVDLQENLLLKLRLIFGCTTKAEVIFHILTHGESNSNQIAKIRFLNQKATYDELLKLSKANFLNERKIGLERLFDISEKYECFKTNIKSMFSLSWFLTLSVFLIEIVFKDLDDEYLIVSSFTDNRKTLLMLIQRIGECKININDKNAYEFYEQFEEYYHCLIKKITKSTTHHL